MTSARGIRTSTVAAKAWQHRRDKEASDGAIRDGLAAGRDQYRRAGRLPYPSGRRTGVSVRVVRRLAGRRPDRHPWRHGRGRWPRPARRDRSGHRCPRPGRQRRPTDGSGPARPDTAGRQGYRLCLRCRQGRIDLGVRRLRSRRFLRRRRGASRPGGLGRCAARIDPQGRGDRCRRLPRPEPRQRGRAGGWGAAVLRQAGGHGAGGSRPRSSTSTSATSLSRAKPCRTAP